MQDLPTYNFIETSAVTKAICWIAHREKLLILKQGEERNVKSSPNLIALENFVYKI